jgi:hypothetical protein
MVKTLDNETLGGPQQIVFLAYHKSKLSTELSPLSNRGYPVSGCHRGLLRFFSLPSTLKTTREESKMSNFHTTLFKIVLYWCLDLIRHNIGTN